MDEHQRLVWFQAGAGNVTLSVLPQPTLPCLFVAVGVVWRSQLPACFACISSLLISFFLHSSAVRLGVGVLLPSRLLHVILPFNEKHVHMFIVYTFRKWRICCSVTLSVSVWTAAHELWQHPMFNLVQWRESFQVWLHSINSEKTENVTLLLTVPLFFQESRGVETVTIYITPTIIFISNKKSKAPYTTQNSVVDICIVTVMTASPSLDW